MEAGNLDAAYYAYQHGARLLRSRLQAGWYHGYTIQPEDLCSYVISKEFAEKAVLFVLAGNDEGSAFGRVPKEMHREHLAPALLSAVLVNTFDGLFYPD